MTLERSPELDAVCMEMTKELNVFLAKYQHVHGELVAICLSTCMTEAALRGKMTPEEILRLVADHLVMHDMTNKANEKVNDAAQ